MTPNNSDQAAMHDELRARLLDVQSQAGKAATQSAYTAAGEKALRMIPELIAALTLPASEAVAWIPAEDIEFSSDYMNAYKRPIGPLADYVPVYATPQPAPAAHAGEEAVACVRREALNFVSDSFLFPPHMADAGDVLLYTHPSPMPVDALRGLLNEVTKTERANRASYAEHMRDGGSERTHSGRRLADAYGWMREQLTALLSGGAAREDKS